MLSFVHNGYLYEAEEASLYSIPTNSVCIDGVFYNEHKKVRKYFPEDLYAGRFYFSILKFADMATKEKIRKLNIFYIDLIKKKSGFMVPAIIPNYYNLIELMMNADKPVYTASVFLYDKYYKLKRTKI